MCNLFGMFWLLCNPALLAEAATLTAKEAQKEKVITLIAYSPQALLNKLVGKWLAIKQQKIELPLRNVRLINQKSDWRSQFIATITNPKLVTYAARVTAVINPADQQGLLEWYQLKFWHKNESINNRLMWCKQAIDKRLLINK